jgi:hypothetical protein
MRPVRLALGLAARASWRRRRPSDAALRGVQAMCIASPGDGPTALKSAEAAGWMPIAENL